MQPIRGSMLSYWLKHPEDSRLAIRNRVLREHGDAAELEALLQEVAEFLTGMRKRMGADNDLNQ